GPTANSTPPKIVRVRAGRWLQLLPPGRFARTRVTLPVFSLPPSLSGLRIAHLTDVHMRRRWMGAYDELLEQIRADPPDLVLFTGDLVEHRRTQPRELELAQRFIERLSARLGVFAIFGNHDGDLLAHQIATASVRKIEKTIVVLENDDAAIE